MKKEIIIVILFLFFSNLICNAQYRYTAEDKAKAESIGSAFGKALADELFSSTSIGEEYKYWAVGMGYGASYGGMGIKCLGRFSENYVAFGMSAGIGHNPDGRNRIESVSGALFLTAGMQIYIENFYFDWQIGQMGRVKYRETGKEVTQFGMAFLGGYNWFFYKNWGINLALGYGGPIPWSQKDEENINEDLFSGNFIGEVGLLFKF